MICCLKEKVENVAPTNKTNTCAPCFQRKRCYNFFILKKKKKIVYFQSSSSHKEQYEYNTQQEKDYESHKTYSHTDLPQQMKKNNDTF